MHSLLDIVLIVLFLPLAIGILFAALGVLAFMFQFFWVCPILAICEIAGKDNS
jgi:hypothetical protein